MFLKEEINIYQRAEFNKLKGQYPKRGFSKITIILLVIFIVLSLVSTDMGLQGVVTKLIWGFIAIGFGAIPIFIVYKLKSQKHYYITKDKSLIIITIFILLLVFVLGFGSGVTNIYKSTSDLIHRKTETIIITNSRLETKRSGNRYYIKGINTDKEEVKFEIGRKTYEMYKSVGVNRKKIRIEYYEYTKVIQEAVILKEE